jgi:hypothetical protein
MCRLLTGAQHAVRIPIVRLCRLVQAGFRPRDVLDMPRKEAGQQRFVPESAVRPHDLPVLIDVQSAVWPVAGPAGQPTERLQQPGCLVRRHSPLPGLRIPAGSSADLMA